MSTINCLVCGKPLVYENNDCPHCKMHYYSAVGGSWAEAVRSQEERAAKYRTETFLPSFELAAICYRWKDQNGKIVQASKDRIVFGSAAKLENKTVWLDQEFARLPDEQTASVEISVRERDAGERVLRFALPMIEEPELQLLGLCLEEGLMLRLKLKTVSGSKMVESNALHLLAD